MTDQAGSAGFPAVATVTLRNARTGETRTFEQAELPIAGEARLLGLVADVGQRLSATDFPWDELAKMFDEQGQQAIDWSRAIGMLGKVAAVAPDALIESTCIFFGIYPSDATGARNPTYEEEKAFIAASLKFVRWVEVVRTFVEQNDYRRLADPFVDALAAGATRIGRTTQPSSSEP